MKTNKKTSRREFLATTGVAAVLTGAFLPFATTMASESPAAGLRRSKIYFFTKPLDKYETEFMAETLAMAGVDGFDLTVRNGGKVDPARVYEELPGVVETGNKYNLATDLMVTGITGTEDRQTEEILKTASGLGVNHYRLGYYDYDFSGGVPASLETIKSRMKDLSAMNRHYNIQAGYQNHDGARFGSPLWDLWEVIKDMPAETISSQYDIRHGMAEGYRSWIIALNLLSSKIGSLAIKDFHWEFQNGRARTTHVPLGEGLVDFTTFVKTIKELNIDVPITLHIEYPLLSKKEENLSLLKKQAIMIGVIKKDVQFLRNLIS